MAPLIPSRRLLEACPRSELPLVLPWSSGFSLAAGGSLASAGNQAPMAPLGHAHHLPDGRPHSELPAMQPRRHSDFSAADRPRASLGSAPRLLEGCSHLDLPMQPRRRSSDFSAAAADPPRASSVGNPPTAPLGTARPTDPSTSTVFDRPDSAALPMARTHVAVASGSSFPGGKMPLLDGNPGSLPPESSSSLQPQPMSGSAGGHVACEPSLGDHFYDGDESSSGQSCDLAARRMLSSLSARIKCCDVYIGMCRSEPSLLRFVNWLRGELQLQGVMCFVSDRSRCTDAHAHRMAREAIDSATLGVVIVTVETFSSPYAMEELKLFLDRRSLVAILFGLSQEECLARDIIERRGELWQQEGGFLWEAYGGLEEEWKEAVNGLSRLECRFEAHHNNWRDCVWNVITVVGKRLGKSGIVEKVRNWKESVAGIEHPFPRNDSFVGREKELLELELTLFGYVEQDERSEMRPRRSVSSLTTENKGGRRSVDLKGKDKEPLLGRRSFEKREMEGRAAEMADYSSRGQKGAGRTRRISSVNWLHGKGVICICGESGIGKTELVLEFTYRFAQRYKMVFWIGGEARYLRQNYLNFLPILGIDFGIGSAGFFEGFGSKRSVELEEQAIHRVRNELMRDIPFLVVIDNLEGEKDWWDGRNLIELLPPFGGETHIIISTRLSRVMDLEPKRLLYLSAAEALTLMKGSLGDLPVEEISALKAIEETLGRVPLGLAIVRAILSEISIRPTKLLDTIKRMPHRNLTWNGRQDPILRYNPGMVQLLDVCFAIFDLLGKHGSLASRMTQACGWFAPSPIPVPVLVAVASAVPQECENNRIWKMWLHVVPCVRMSHYRQLEAKATEVLVRFQVARCSNKSGFIHFHDMIKLYARKRESSSIAHAMIQAIGHYGSPRQHSEHIWAASFLLFNFGTDPAVISLKLPELLNFIKKHIIPLACDTFNIFFRYGAALELLHQAMKALEAAKPPQLVEGKRTLEKPSRWRISKDRLATKSDSHLYEECAAVQATLLETMSKLMHTGPINSINNFSGL